ncbi:MAG TPA: hypothetical protein VLD37_01035 [Candidatus Bilamarchaeum sp.]|nr:hypothetical protein [Candidatus Bilamarchaeum sp.]
MSPARYLLLVLVLSAAAFSTAPAWVVKDTVVEYSVGSDKITFTVLSNNGTDVKMQIKPSTAPNSYTATENASAMYGQIWFDSELLSGASYGRTYGDLTVTDEGTETYAGKEYHTITLNGEISGSDTTRVYDKETGLMLKQTVTAAGAPQVVLAKFTPPAAPAPPPPPPPQQPANQTNTSQPSQPQQPPANQTSQPSQPSQPYQPPTVTPNPPAEEPAEETPEAPAKRSITSACCGSAVILLALLAAFAKREA